MREICKLKEEKTYIIDNFKVEIKLNPLNFINKKEINYKNNQNKLHNKFYKK